MSGDGSWHYESYPLGIDVFCHTNLDDFKREKWPTLFTCKPAIGEKVRAESGAELKIVAVTHCQDSKKNAYLDVELHRW